MNRKGKGFLAAVVIALSLAQFKTWENHADNILVFGDSHWAEGYGDNYTPPQDYLERWGHTVTCECYGGRALTHWSWWEWQRPGRETDVFIIALMTNDIFNSVSLEVNLYPAYRAYLDKAIRNRKGARVIVVLPTLFWGMDAQIHLWRYLTAVWLSSNHPGVTVVDAVKSRQSISQDGIHYADSYMYARHINEKI